jgi:hypothetical protein
VRLLDSALLEQLKGRWQQQSAEIAGCLAPGLTVDEIDTLEQFPASHIDRHIL